MIQINCNQSLSYQFQWLIKNCTTTCSNTIQLDRTITTTFPEIYIPARTFQYGIYELEFQMTTNGHSNSIKSKFAYVRITRSGITVNLVRLGTSMITNGYENDLKLDPGRFSIDPDENIFNSSVKTNLRRFELIILFL